MAFPKLKITSVRFEVPTPQDGFSELGEQPEKPGAQPRLVQGVSEGLAHPGPATPASHLPPPHPLSFQARATRGLLA